MAQAPLHSKTPPTMQQTEYILASRKASVRTQRTWQGALSVGLVVALVLATFAFLQRQQAIRQRDAAVSRLLIDDSEILADTDPVVQCHLDKNLAEDGAHFHRATRPDSVDIRIISPECAPSAFVFANFLPWP